jgi:hypothetical protein
MPGRNREGAVAFAPCERDETAAAGWPLIRAHTLMGSEPLMTPENTGVAGGAVAGGYAQAKEWRT